MTEQDHENLCRIQRQAAATAASAGLHIAVCDSFYFDEKEERFCYVPVQGLDILFRADHFALVGIYYPNGHYRSALELVEIVEAL